MADITGTIVYIINSYATWAVVIIGGVLIVLTEISKLCRWTSSNKDDLIISKLIAELTEWKNKIANLIKK